MVTLSAYLSPTWRQTRELSYIAISAGAIDVIQKQAKLAMPVNWDVSNLPYISPESFVKFFDVYRHISARHNLVGAVSRACLSTKLFTEESNKKKNRNEEMWWAASIEEKRDGTRYRFDAALGPDQNGYAREFVCQIYNQHKVGRNEPSMSIFRVSSRIDIQNEEQTLESLWPKTDVNELPRDKIIAVVSNNPSNRQKYPEFCLFTMDDSSLDKVLDSNLDSGSVARPCLRARRLDVIPGWTRGWNDAALDCRDEYISDKVTKLLDQVKHTKASLENGETRDDVGRSSRQQWKTKDTGAGWKMISSVPVSLMDLLKFKNALHSRGRKLTTITVHRQSTGEWISVRSQNGEQNPASAANVAGYYMDNDAANGIMETPETPSRKRPQDSLYGIRDYDENFNHINEASSSNSAGKRRRFDREQYAEDYLNDDELERLMADGHFQ